MPRLLEIEYGVGDVNSIPVLTRLSGGVSTLDRATQGRRSTSPRFRDVLAPADCGRELRAVARDRKGSTWGGFTLFRSTDDADFNDAECCFVARIGADVAAGLRRTMLMTEAARRVHTDAPGIGILDANGARLEVEVASHTMYRWLEDISDGRLAPSQLPISIATLAHRATQDPSGIAQTTVRGRSGRWITIHVETIPAATGVPNPGRERLTLLVEPTRPHQLAEVIAAAYALSARERQVARLALAGYSNREIAAALYVSPHTVSDHLKAIFSKLEVGSRAQLTSRMFFDQYLPRSIEGLPIGGDGWYITEP